MPLAERKCPVSSANRHPAERLPGRTGILSRSLLLLVHDRGNGSAELELAGPALLRSQVLQLTLDKAGVDRICLNGRVGHQRHQERDVGDDAANVGLFQPATELL